jgi:hypothetical protein
MFQLLCQTIDVKPKILYLRRIEPIALDCCEPGGISSDTIPERLESGHLLITIAHRRLVEHSLPGGSLRSIFRRLCPIAVGGESEHDRRMIAIGLLCIRMLCDYFKPRQRPRFNRTLNSRFGR